MFFTLYYYFILRLLLENTSTMAEICPCTYSTIDINPRTFQLRFLQIKNEKLILDPLANSYRIRLNMLFIYIQFHSTYNYEFLRSFVFRCGLHVLRVHRQGTF